MGRTPAYDLVIRLLQEARRRNLVARNESPPLPRIAGGWNRRRVLSAAAATGGALTAAASFPDLSFAHQGRPPRVVVVGAGIAGLCAGYHLKKAGIDAKIFEARRRLGGRIFTVEGAVGDELITELGGSFINSDHEDMLALVEEFGLEVFSRLDNARGIPHSGAAFYFEDRRWDEVEVAEALRPIAEQMTEDADRLDEDFDAVGAVLDRLSVEDYLDLHADRLGEPFIRTLLENVIRAEYGVEPSESSALQLVYALPTVEGTRVDIASTSDENFVIQGGNSKLVEALGQALAGQIELHRVLRRIEPACDGFRLTFAPHHVVEADYVIIAMPFTTLRRVHFQIELPAGLRRFIEEVELGRNEKLVAGFSSRPWRTQNGFVLEAATDLGFTNVWDDTQQQDRTDAGLTFFFGGDQVGQSRRRSLRSDGQRVVDQLDAFAAGVAEAATGRFVRSRWTGDPFTRGAYTSFKPGQLTRFAEFLYVEADDPEERQDAQVGNLVFAGEQFSDAYYGFMNGGAQTGRLAARAVLAKIEEADQGPAAAPTPGCPPNRRRKTRG
ncbi:MAG: NAD(P)/FAD-dependent oxidoreductase [Pseudomonadota bacterium]